MTELGNNGGGGKHTSVTEEPLSEDLVRLFRERPLPEPSPEATRAVLAAAHAKVRDVQEAECEVLPAALPERKKKRTLWATLFWRPRFAAAAATLLMAIAVWQLVDWPARDPVGPGDDVEPPPIYEPPDPLDPDLAWNAVGDRLYETRQRLFNMRPVSYQRRYSEGEMLDHQLLHMRGWANGLHQEAKRGMPDREPAVDYEAFEVF